MGAAAVIGPPLPPPPLPPPQPAITMASAKNVNIDTAYLTLVAILTEPPSWRTFQFGPGAEPIGFDLSSL